MTTKESTMILLKKVQAIKYKYALVPLLLVVGSFFLSNKLPKEIVQILSVSGMLLYLMILFKFRIGHVGIEIEPTAVVSPISGKITSIDENDSIVKIKIEKNNLDPCGIRFTFDNDIWEGDSLINSKTNLSCEFSSKKIIKNITDQSTQGALAGFYLFRTSCSVCLSTDKIKANVKVGDKCFAGKTTLGFYNEN